MRVNVDVSPRHATRRAAERYAAARGYQSVGKHKHLMNGRYIAVIEYMPASGTFKVIEGVPA